MTAIPIWMLAVQAYCRIAPFDRGKTRLLEIIYRRLAVPPIEVLSTLSTGAKIRLRLCAWVDFNIFCIGLYEHYLARYFAGILRSDAVFLDVGAYIGQYSLLAAHYAPRGKIIALEPVPETARRLRVALAENHISNCEVIETAAGDHCATAQLHLSHDLSSSSISETHARSQYSITVPVVTIDAVVEQRGLTKVDIIKVDVESWEDAAISGAKETLARFLPQVLLEVGRDCEIQQPTPALALLATLGYRFFRMNHGKLDQISGHIEAAENVIALPPG